MISLNLNRETIIGRTDRVLDALYASVTGAVSRGAIAAVEAVSVRVAAMMATAEVRGQRGAPLTPDVLSYMGRALVERGESLHVIGMVRGRRRLLPVSYDWDITGEVDPATWQYSATLFGPSQTRDTRDYMADEVLHVIRDPSPVEPWRGVSPLARANVTLELAKLAEDALLRECRLPSKALLPMPAGSDQSLVDSIRADLQSTERSVLLPETTQAGFGAGRTSAPQADWKPQRVQPAPMKDLVDLAAQAQARVVAALGVHPALVGGGGAAGGSVDREAAKQFMDMVVEPLSTLIAGTASRTLGGRIELHFDVRDDVMLTRARTAAMLMAEPVMMPPAEAFKLARLT